MLKSKRLILRGLIAQDLSDSYLNWLNDPEVNRYLETRFLPQTVQALHDYWQNHRDDPNSPWFAICTTSDNQHIGNIKVGPIQWTHRRADVSLFIGEKTCWGKGYATEAISLICEWSFLTLDMQKLSAGIYEGNIGSRKAFEKCNFKLEGTLRNEVVSQGKRLDVWRLGLTREDWNECQ